MIPPVIAIDCRMSRHSGIGVHITAVVPRVAALRPDWRLRLLGVPVGSSLERLVAEFRPLGAPIYSVREQFELRAATRDARLVWSPHYNAALAGRARLLVTVHDVNHLAMPEFVGGIARRLYARTMFEAVRRRADGLLFVSDFSKREFERCVGPLRQPHWITPNAVEDRWRVRAGPAVGRERDYVVVVGSIKPHKNLAAALAAFDLIKDRVDLDLVIIGREKGLLNFDSRITEAARASHGRIVFTGDVGDAELVGWVSGARALLAPSLYEGFGLTPLEAMAAGCPAIISDIPAHREVCGDAAIYVDAGSPAAFADAIMKILSDDAHAAEYRRRGLERSQQFDWEDSARIVVEAAESIIATGPSLSGS